MIDFSSFFYEYEKIARGCEAVFLSLKEKYPQEVTCREGCVDCCYALFDLSFIEALYINHRFNESFSGKNKEVILERADRADREVYRIKRWAFKERQKGVPEDIIFEEIARKKVRCPLLGDDNRCLMYEYRPVTCRVYGIPLVVGERVTTCARTGFKPGEKYDVVFMDKIHKKLYELSVRAVESFPTRYPALAEMLIPLSMALLTEYNDEYLGVIRCEEKPGPMGPSWTIGGE